MKKAEVEIFRYSQDDKQSSGMCMVFDEKKNLLFSCLSLERGWMDNQFRISCLPNGIYPLKFEYSPAFGRKLWEIKNTEPRTECKFHPASFWKDLNGCISLGLIYKPIDNDGYLDLSYSAFAINRFHSVLKQFDEVELKIHGLDWLN
jgi:hypothetical protein